MRAAVAAILALTLAAPVQAQTARLPREAFDVVTTPLTTWQAPPPPSAPLPGRTARGTPPFPPAQGSPVRGPDAAPSMPLDLPGTPSAPGLPAPVLDLSLPPDLSDLQGLSRD